MEQLLGFEADEFYFKCWPELAGLTFGQVLFCFADAVPLGMRLQPVCDAFAKCDIATIHLCRDSPTHHFV